MSIRTLAATVGVQASTISRSLSNEAFSDKLRLALLQQMGGDADKNEIAFLLREALLMMREADRIRVQAQASLQRALDQLNRNQ